MRASAHSIKGRGKGCAIQQEPREGTDLRKAYDRAITGEWFTLEGIKNRHSITMLRLNYELEFKIERGYLDKRPTRYKCIGRWQGADLKSILEVEEAIEFTKQGK